MRISRTILFTFGTLILTASASNALTVTNSSNLSIKDPDITGAVAHNKAGRTDGL